MSAITHQRSGLLTQVGLTSASSEGFLSARTSPDKLLTREQECEIGRRVVCFRRAFQRLVMQERMVMNFLLKKLLTYQRKGIRFDMLFDIPLKEMEKRRRLEPKIRQAIRELKLLLKSEQSIVSKGLVRLVESLKIRPKYFEQAPFENNKAKQIHRFYVANVQAMAVANLRLVVSVCQKLCHDSVLQNDLVQDGYRGLMMAVTKFDYRRGIRFSTYATPWIRKSILEAMPNQNRMIRVPDHFRSSLVNWLNDAHVGHRNSTTSDAERLSELSGMSYLESVRLVRVQQDTQSLDGRPDDSSASGMANLLVDRQSLPREHAELNERQRMLASGLSSLNQREREVILNRYGLKDGRHKSLAEVGRTLEKSREQVRQLEKSALRKLAETLPAEM